jgi:Family of unknown function (DUF5724)/Domain of unknown function (DUF4132)
MSAPTAADILAPYQQAWKKPFLERAAGMPGALALLLPTVVRDDYEGRDAFLLALTDLFVRNDPAEVAALCQVFFPGFADTAARTIGALLTRHPYPQGYTRRAFRAPGHRLQAVSTAAWVHQTWQLTREYPQDIEWFAVHAGLLPAWTSYRLGVLLAQAIDDGNAEVFQILRDTAGTQHPVARMGRHVPGALLSSSNPDAWALAEGLLLAAQRQEGLRQVILESIDEAHPQAFVRVLRIILKEDLLRFAACLRAADVWFGLSYDVTDLKTVRPLLERALAHLEDPAAAREVVRSGAAQEAYLALFTLAMQDAHDAAKLARTLLTHPQAEHRMAAVQFLSASELLEQEERSALLADPDVRIGAVYANSLNRWQTDSGASFEAVADYAARLGAAEHRPLLFPWLGHVPSRADVTDVLPSLLGDEPFTALAPHLPSMSGDGKVQALGRLAHRGKTETLDAPTRELLMTLLQDRNSGVSQEAVKVAELLTLAPDEAQIIEVLLKRRSADLRRGLIRLLARDPAMARGSAATLLSTRNVEQRQAGLQLLIESGGELPDNFRAQNSTEAALQAQLLGAEGALTLDNGLGLFDPGALAPLPSLQAQGHDFAADVRRGAELLASLDALIHTHRETPLTERRWDGEHTVLLGNAQLRYYSGEPMPLAELWQDWWNGRLQPEPGDLTRMHWALNHFVATKTAAPMVEEEEWDGEDDDEDAKAEQLTASAVPKLREQTLHRLFGPLVPLWMEYAGVIPFIVRFLNDQETADRSGVRMALDAWETALSYLPADAEVVGDLKYSWRSTDPRDLLTFLRPYTALEGWTPDQQRRHWELLVYHDRGFAKLPRARPDTAPLLNAQAQGWASHHDFLDSLIGPRATQVGSYSSRGDFDQLTEYTRRKLRANLPVSAAWMQAVAEVRERVLEVELSRGDLETPATAAALCLQSVDGAATLLTLLAGLGKNPLRRGYIGSNESRDTTFSHLIRVSFPVPSDTPVSFAAQARALKISDARLLDLVMFAPQWAELVSKVLKWPGLHSAVYWLHAHTKDSSWSVPAEVREAWEAEISERTPLGASDLTEGAVDVAWFRAVYKQLGQERFRALLGAAKYASSSGGHKRAELFARAILGQEDEAELRGRITEKRHQDAVRALGLLPISKKTAARDLERRYRLLADFRRGAKQFGAQRQASERLAADIGMQNLARTAGYTDPQRLTWAMEARMAPDWGQVVDEGGVTVRIDLTAQGEASLHVARGEKVLKTLPAALNRHAGVLELKATVSELKATRRRMRAALEDAMVRGDLFQGAELEALSQHPVIAPMLGGLLWVLNEAHTGWWMPGGTVLAGTMVGGTVQTQDGPQAVGDQALRLAHPHDLFVGGHWRAFQQQVMDEELAQPFKQVFREYYPLTPAEAAGDSRRSLRYDGHAVQPTQAAALLKSRGWVTVPEEGVRKTFHAEGLNVWVDSSLGYGTPNEIEGALLRAVYFIARDETELLPLSSVPPRLFSEIMRDLDLVVSVAHVGGVDPEASVSTVEMRSGLLRETLRLLKLQNVRLDSAHALIDGHYAQYSVHLGSGTVHRLPGGFLCVVPVHNQAQGRLFLPFADPDPRTAEVVSKVLLLAEDRKIQDPSILEQFR